MSPGQGLQGREERRAFRGHPRGHGLCGDSLLPAPPAQSSSLLSSARPAPWSARPCSEAPRMWPCPCPCCRTRRVKCPALPVGRVAIGPGPGRRQTRGGGTRGSPAAVHLRSQVGDGNGDGDGEWLMGPEGTLGKARGHSAWSSPRCRDENSHVFESHDR